MLALAKKKLAEENESSANSSDTKNLKASNEIESVNPTVGFGDPRDEENTVELLTRIERLLQAPVLIGVVKVSIITNMRMVTVERNPNNRLNRMSIVVSLLFEFRDTKHTIEVLKSEDFIAADFTRETTPTGFRDIALPIRFKDSRINFDLTARLTFTVKVNYFQTKIGNQLTIGRSVNVYVTTNAAVYTPDRGGIKGYAHFQGTLVNLATSHTSVVALNREAITIDNKLSTTINPFKYQFFQKFQAYGCWRRTFLWWGRRVWCDWSVAVDNWFVGAIPSTLETSFRNTVAIA